jgi:acyl-CoA reductase-like NAD-dependent aldehyde dehydrogenase
VCLLVCRNAIVLSPHVRAAKCSIEAARIVREAAEAAGAPKGLIQWIEKPSLAMATALMKDPKINLILATGAAWGLLGVLVKLAATWGLLLCGGVVMCNVQAYHVIGSSAAACKTGKSKQCCSGVS